MLEEEVKRKIIAKILGIAKAKIILNEQPKLTTGQFRFILGEYKIHRKDWFKILKELENEGILKYKKFHIYIFPENL